MTTVSIDTSNVATAAKKLLLPVGAIVAAGLIAGFMGVPWSNSGDGGSGVRLMADANQGATLTISQIEPGDSISRSVTIRNSGGQPSRLTFQETGDPAAFADGELQLRIVQGDQTLYDGDFAAMSDLAQDVGVLDPGGSSTFTFTVSLPDDAPFANQGDPATVSYNWVNSDANGTDSWSG